MGRGLTGGELMTPVFGLASKASPKQQPHVNKAPQLNLLSGEQGGYYCWMQVIKMLTLVDK